LLVLGAVCSMVSASVARSLPATHTYGSAHPNIHAVKEGESALGKPAGVHFSCQDVTAPIHCYGPAQIRNAYNINPLLSKGIDGTGRTIVIIDAYQSPTIASDLATFDHVFGLPDPKLNIIAPDGLTPFDWNDPIQVDWAGEITLDVEWSHAVAPGATIDLVLAATSNDADLLRATKYVAKHSLGDVVSQSFGEGETCSAVPLSDLHKVFKQATGEGITLLASSGDSGAGQAPQFDATGKQICGDAYSLFKSASTPADDPLVTGVGGTSLNAGDYVGHYIGETAWNDAYGASGGGYSTVFARPSYQDHFVHRPWRGVPDVAYNGDVNNGVLAVWTASSDQPAAVYIFGGTSAGSPQWAGIVALADQQAGKRLGFLNAAFYRIAADGTAYRAAFHDITTGNNVVSAFDADSDIKTFGYNTSKSWDAVTGLGSPNVDNLLRLLSKNVKPGDANGL